MRLLFKQHLFSWFDSYDIYNEDGETLFTVEGQISWGHCLHILDARGSHIGTVQEKVLTFLPKFELYAYGEYIGHVASISKELFNWTDTYVIDVPDPANALCALMVVLAIDAEKCRG